jgi:signal transduction histidine kinase
MRADAFIAMAVVAGCCLLGVAGLPEWYWSAGAAVLLVIRRTAPLLFLALASAVSGAHLLVSGSFMFPGDLISLVAVHAVAAYAPPSWRHAGLLLGVAGAAEVAGWAWRERAAATAVLPAVLIIATVLAAWSTGLMHRQQRAAVLDAEHRRHLAEQDSALRARLAVQEERTRISREMHDIIAHSLASIIAQAEGGRVAARADVALAGPLFDRIAHLGREALTDVRRLLAVVDGDDHGIHAKGLCELADLITGVTAAGLDVTIERTGSERPLAPGMDLAVYRVIQESLTNVLKHAPRRVATLRLDWTSTMLTVTVTSPMPEGVRWVEEGRGLSGIRQRCSLYNGVCTVTPGADFTVTTTWPLSRQEVPA